jgi:hypothetical protein
MLKNLFKFSILVVSIFVSSQMVLAEGLPKLNEKDVYKFLDLLKNQKDNLTLDRKEMIRLMGGESSFNSIRNRSSVELGFGYYRLYRSIKIGDFSNDAIIIMNNGKPVGLKIIIALKKWSESSPKEVDILNSAWEDLGTRYNSPYWGDLLYFESINKISLEKWRKILAKEFGEQIQVEIPDSVKKDYEYLMSPFEKLTYGSNCGDVGTPPAGNSEMEALVNQKNYNLIKSVLRSPNREARAYAAFALIELDNQKKNILNEEEKNSIKKILNSKIKITHCRGCRQETISTFRFLKEESETNEQLKKYIVPEN